MNHCTVLLIEDDAFFSQIMKQALEERGYDVVWAPNGEEGVRQVHALKPDLITLGIAMPKKDGFQVLDELKSEAATKQIPIMMLTSMSAREDIERCLQTGACEYMIKAHHTPLEVVERIARLLPLDQSEV